MASRGDEGLKILLATHWFLPHVGGAWVYIETLKQGLERMGHQVDVFATIQMKKLLHGKYGSVS